MKFHILVNLVLVGHVLVSAEEKKDNKDKRGVIDVGYGQDTYNYGGNALEHNSYEKNGLEYNTYAQGTHGLEQSIYNYGQGLEQNTYNQGEGLEQNTYNHGQQYGNHKKGVKVIPETMELHMISRIMLHSGSNIMADMDSYMELDMNNNMALDMSSNMVLDMDNNMVLDMVSNMVLDMVSNMATNIALVTMDKVTICPNTNTRY
ncbi:hypothetical protein CBL_01545 [Carabus blaptoides fortunei]